MKKTLCLLVIILVFNFTKCDTGNENGDEEFTVSFELNGGTVDGIVTFKKITVKSGGIISTLPNPQKGTDIFDGWFIDNNTFLNEFTSSTVITQNITVFAKWTPIFSSSPFEGTWELDSGAYFTFNEANFISQYKIGEQYEIGNYWIMGTWETENSNLLNITITHMANYPGVATINELPEGSYIWVFTYEFLSKTSLKLHSKEEAVPVFLTLIHK
jgi:uncharacterized repeat protein (TIGR02543 family)